MKSKNGNEFKINDYVQITETDAYVICEVLEEKASSQEDKAFKYYSGDYDHPMRPAQDIKTIALEKNKLYAYWPTKAAGEIKPGEFILEGISGYEFPVERIVEEKEDVITFELEHHPSEAEYYNDRYTHKRTYLKDQLLATRLNN